MMKIIFSSIIIGLILSCPSCVSNKILPVPNDIIDLGALITEDLPEQVWGWTYATLWF